MTTTKLKPKRKRASKKKGKYYFTSEHEEAIIKYAKTDDRKIRSDLYVEWIQPAFNEMVDKIVYTYKFSNLPNIDLLREECKNWLVTILDKYDPSKGSKAFSYFSVITKNWFIHKVKKTKQKYKREIQFDDLPSDAEFKYMSKESNYDDLREEAEFWQFLLTEIKSWNIEGLKPNEKKVLDAVMILIESCDDIEIFNKKAIYLYMREITGLTTKQVVNNLNKLRKKYRVFKLKWNEGEIN